MKLPQLASALVLVTASVLSVGCRGELIYVDGIAIYEKNWNKALEELGPQASYALNCPREQLAFTLLRRADGMAAEVGVEGCGRRALYIHPTEHSRVWVQQGDQVAIAAAAQEEEDRERAAKRRRAQNAAMMAH